MLPDLSRHLILIFGPTVLAFLIALFLTKPFLKFITEKRLCKQIREISTTGEKAEVFQKLHAKKRGTPTMGGILIWGTVLIIVLFSFILSRFGLFEYSLLNRKETYLPLFALITTAVLGLIDDLFNIKGLGDQKGINLKPKFLWLTAFAIAGGLWFHYKLGYDLIHIPFFGDFFLGWLYIPLFVFIILASSNAVNFTDGLDGLAGGLLIIAFGAFGVISFANGLLILTALCGAIIGATLAFLWFNIAPAKFYMGDTGSLSLGATLGVLAMLTNSVVILPFIGIIFVIEALSVIIQLFSKKFFHKKVFNSAPLHHHLESIGWPETQIVMRFWIIGGIFAFLGLILGLTGIG